MSQISNTTRELADKLHELGWVGSCDAQWTKLDASMDEVRKIVSPPVGDGGPAFPIPDGITQVNGYQAGYGDYTTSVRAAFGGMSLRDYFAAKAMAALIPDANTQWGGRSTSISFRAELAYEWADAMLAERSKATPST